MPLTHAAGLIREILSAFVDDHIHGSKPRGSEWIGGRFTKQSRRQGK
jgi:hypothetical protein